MADILHFWNDIAISCNAYFKCYSIYKCALLILFIIQVLMWPLDMILIQNTNKANLTDLIAATGLVILLKFDTNHRFLTPHDFEIWWITSRIIEHLFYTTLSLVHHFKSISEFKLELQSGNIHLRSKSAIFAIYDFEIWWMALKNNRAPLLCYVKLCASFQCHLWI